jgi:uncharacterized membrane protein
MGLILVVVFVITAYGTDLLLQRILHTTHEEAALLRDLDALADEVRKHRAHADCVEREVALMCAAADADAAEFRKLCEGCANGATPIEPAANGKSESTEANGTSATEANGHTHVAVPDARLVRPTPSLRSHQAYKKAQAARRSQIRLGVAAGLAGGAILGSVLGRM